MVRGSWHATVCDVRAARNVSGGGTVRRASRIARRGRRRGRRRATNALGGAGATASSHDFSRLVALLDESLMDRIASSLLFACAQLSKGLIGWRR